MKIFSSRWPSGLATLLLLGTASVSAQQSSPKSQVVVLCTLHQFHETNAGYSFSVLSQLLERLRPDVLAVELTPSDLAGHKDQKTKQEYPRSVFPFLAKHRVHVVPMEPAEPLFSQLVGAMRGAGREMEEKAPQKSEAFGIYVDRLYEYLFQVWDSPLSVNSRQTDAHLEVKHSFQNALYGPEEERGWEGWNTHFLSRIVDAARANPGKRIVVVVGVEHGYWLRKRLQAQNELTVVPLEDAIR